jgi:tRNA dimethylallyltransferase
VTAGSGEQIRVVVVAGPTASGKTEAAIRLAERFDGEIVNADSMQVYRGMDVGTAKPTAEQRSRVPHHLMDIVTPYVNFSASDFRRAAAAAIADIQRRGKRVFIVGGTGLYLRALLEGLVDAPAADAQLRRELEEQAARIGGEEMLALLAEVDPDTAARLHPNDLVRIVRSLEVYRQTGRPVSAYRDEHGFGGRHYEPLKLGLMVERQELYRRAEARVDRMLEVGFIDEVRRLLDAGYGPDLKSMRSIGYKEIAAYLRGDCSLDEAVRLMKRDTRRYAKRQLTWFRTDREIIWLEYPDNFATMCSHVIEFY